MTTLTAYYLSLPEEVRSTGTANYAEYPPLDGNFLTAKLWDAAWGNDWRRRVGIPKPPRDPIADKKLLAMIKKRMKEYEKVKRNDETG
jgi:hypothetical protein